MKNLEFVKDKNKLYLAITGHADIETAFGDEKEEIGYNSETYLKAEKHIDDMIKVITKNKNINPNDIVFISGMARGIDEIFAVYAVKHKLSLQLFIPYSVQWHQFRDLRSNGGRAQAYDYQGILDYVNDKAKQGDRNCQIFEIPKYYNGEQYKFANFARNQAMVDNCDNLISVLVASSNGTEDCISRGKKANKYIGNCIEFGDLNSVETNFLKQVNNCLSFEFNTDLFKNKLNINVLCHGANCFNTMGKGIALWIKKTYPEAYQADLNYLSKGDRNKLGSYSIAEVHSNDNKYLRYVANLYTQYTMYNENDKFDLKSFESSITKLFNDLIKMRLEKHKDNALNVPIKVGIPPIGLGISNADTKEVFNTLIKISKQYENQAMKLFFCIHPKDIELNNTFKSYLDNFDSLKKEVSTQNILMR